MTAVATVDDVLVDLFTPLRAETLAELFEEYAADLAAMASLSQSLSNSRLVKHFVDANAGRGSHLVLLDRLGRLDTAAKALDASYWQRALDLTDVLDAMPQARRDEWHESLSAMKVPPFEPETVVRTLREMLDQRAMFFAQRVDGIFQGLSREHLTNRPSGFSKRMIIAGAYDGLGPKSHYVGLIHDLRGVVARLRGHDAPNYRLSYSAVDYARRSRTGEWVALDGGAVRLRLYMNGNAHIEVHEDVAWRLNAVLAHLHPGAIPAEHRRRPKVLREKEYKLFDHPIAPAVLLLLEGNRFAHDKGTDRWWVSLRSYEVLAAVRRQAIDVLVALGGYVDPRYVMEDAGSSVAFTYDPSEVLAEVLATGMLPDKDAHQFYPTPHALVEVMLREAQVLGKTLLEPHGGLGHIAWPAHQAGGLVTVVEVSRLHCIVLRARGLPVVHEGDFLKLWPTLPLFDRVLMNPPFSEGRAARHLLAGSSRVAPGGRLTAYLPAANKAVLGVVDDLRVDGWTCCWGEPVPFPGTSIMVTLLVADRPGAE
jgi:hypothetical protein